MEIYFSVGNYHNFIPAHSLTAAVGSSKAVLYLFALFYKMLLTSATIFLFLDVPIGGFRKAKQLCMAFVLQYYTGGGISISNQCDLLSSVEHKRKYLEKLLLFLTQLQKGCRSTIKWSFNYHNSNPKDLCAIFWWCTIALGDVYIVLYW